MADSSVKLNNFLVQLTQDVALAHTEMQSLQRMAWAETIVHYRQQAEQDRNDEVKQIRAEVLSEWNNMVDLAIDEVKLSFNLSKRSWLSRTWGRILHPFSGKQARYKLSASAENQVLQNVEIIIRRTPRGDWQSQTNLASDKSENEVQAPKINE